MEQEKVVNEKLRKVTDYIEDLRLKKVWFGGFEKVEVQNTLQVICSMYEDAFGEAERDFNRQIEKGEQDLQRQMEKVQNLEEKNQEIIQKLKKTENYYQMEEIKMNGMKEQLAESIMKTNIDRKKILENAKSEKKEIIERAEEEAAQIIDHRIDELNELVNKKMKELKELQELQKNGVDLIENIQSEISQLSFKFGHIKRQLSNIVNIPNDIRVDNKDGKQQIS